MTGRNLFEDFFELLFLPKLFMAFRIAMQPSKLILALGSIMIIFAAGWIMDMSKPVVSGSGPQMNELDVYLSQSGQTAAFIDQYKDKLGRAGVFETLWDFSQKEFHTILRSLFDLEMVTLTHHLIAVYRGFKWAFRYHPVYCSVFVTMSLAVFAVAGGSICRLATLQFSRAEKPGLTESLRYSLRRFRSFFMAPFAPIFIVFCLGVILFGIGLLCNIPVLGPWIVALSMPINLVLGALMTIFAIGTFLGYTLMYPAIAYDDDNFFSAWGRSFQFVYARPWWLGFYLLVGFIYGAICYLVMRFFTYFILWFSHTSMKLAVWSQTHNDMNRFIAIWPAPSPLNLMGQSTAAELSTHETIVFYIIRFFVLIVIGLLTAFVISFYYSINTIIFACLRKKIDHLAIEQVCPDKYNQHKTTEPPISDSRKKHPNSIEDAN